MGKDGKKLNVSKEKYWKGVNSVKVFLRPGVHLKLNEILRGLKKRY